MARPSSAMADALALVAPGQPLREGLERVLQAKRGALIVIGDDPDVLSICTGGFLFDAEFSPQRLSELAKMDGAIILSADASRIARANVHLMPSPTIPTSETGTRHRTAERVARAVDVPVVSVSQAMGILTIYRGSDHHALQPAPRLHDRVNQALQTMQRFRHRFDLAATALSVLEVEDTVTVRDVAAVLQPAELVCRIADEVETVLAELGADGRLLRLQLDELVDGVDSARRLVVRDYLVPSVAPSADMVPNRGGMSTGLHRAGNSSGRAGGSGRRLSPTDLSAEGHQSDGRQSDGHQSEGRQGDGQRHGGPDVGGDRQQRGSVDGDGRSAEARVPDAEAALYALSRLDTDDLLDPRKVAAALGLSHAQADIDCSVEPRGYRLLHRLPRFPEVVVDRIVERFAGLQRIMRASVHELEQVGGVGEMRARSVKDGLARLAEANILDRYS